MSSFASLIIYGVVAVTVNLLVLLSFVRGGLTRAPNSSIYILALQTLLVDFIFIAIHLFYWIPKAVDPTFLHLSNYENYALRVADFVGTYAWFHNALGHVFIAWNRFAVLVFFERSIFTRERVVCMAVAHHVVSTTVTVLTQFAIPCCRLSFNFDIFTYYNVPNGILPNYSDTYLTVPINVFSTTTSLFCYTAIFVSVRRARSNTFLDDNERVKQKRREYRYAIQFASLALVFSFCWISFRIFPLFISFSDPSLVWMYGLTTVTVMSNCFMNALVYLLNNTDVQKNLSFKCFKRTTIDTESTTVLQTFSITKF
ncbi:hypothetical protein PRIPAC_81180 [Pristionchus pacificus]|uniref:G protein-coupled receptor n=1 Tax=Pristionchus pacificus TaxID=54126 RepID=A0A2A6CM97_PRIPA|nr:hypothetical protein PRIPAC_81180 [Pristionchus pacificus]|eukprot:PDM79229.1 G protein-coupled receptor [Pristionchus pacificus]